MEPAQSTPQTRAQDAAVLQRLLDGGSGSDDVDPVSAAVSSDAVLGVVERVRADLRRRRERGELPDLPAGELTSQFDGVVEAVDAGLVEQPPFDVPGLLGDAELPAWRPVPTGGPLKRLAVLAVRFPARVIGVFVRRQVEPFTARSAEISAQLADRQTRISRFLVRAHLERIRSLESRVARLEEEVRRLRNGEPGTSAR